MKVRLTDYMEITHYDFEEQNKNLSSTIISNKLQEASSSENLTALCISFSLPHALL